MDGSPRLESMIGPLSSQKAGLQVHPRNQNEFATSAVPQDRRLRNTSLRLVISPKREVPTPKFLTILTLQKMSELSCYVLCLSELFHRF